MNSVIEIRIPKFPECWKSCGSCGSGRIIVDDILVAPGDQIARDDTLIILETGKVALDIPSPASGRVVELFITAGDSVLECQVFMALDIDG